MSSHSICLSADLGFIDYAGEQDFVWTDGTPLDYEVWCARATKDNQAICSRAPRCPCNAYDVPICICSTFGYKIKTRPSCSTCRSPGEPNNYGGGCNDGRQSVGFRRTQATPRDGRRLRRGLESWPELVRRPLLFQRPDRICLQLRLRCSRRSSRTSTTVHFAARPGSTHQRLD